MPVSPALMKILLLIPLAIPIVYYDVRYRRIPNLLVLAAFVAGLAIHISFAGFEGAASSLAGAAVAFLPMFLIHIVGAMGAGDVKLFAAVGAVLGIKLIPATFVLVVMIGGVLAVYSMLRSGTVFTTLHGVARIFVGVLPGWEMPRFAIAPDRRHTIPYGVAIMFGSLVTAIWFRT
ncbi:MAG: A24 family peptidase [Pyrinomonadaceae bacterium]